jgi:hypothetical protein
LFELELPVPCIDMTDATPAMELLRVVSLLDIVQC